MVRVFHCDDSASFRLLVHEMLQGRGDVEIVGDAGTLDEALVALPRANPDVVLVDLFERERAGELLSLLRQAAPGARMIVYTGMPAERTPGDADAYVHKSVPFDELHDAITQVAAT